jgi:putative ABC transport system permease protein
MPVSAFRRAVLRLLNFFRPGRAERDLAREVASHLALLEEQFRDGGLSAEEARFAARRAFGGVEQAKELQRDARSFRWLDDAVRDARYAARMLLRTPGFTAVAIVTLALGIGANSAIFTVVHAVLLRPLPYPQPDRLVGIVQRHTSFGLEFATWPDYTDWRDRSTSVEKVGGAWTRVFNLTGIEEPERLSGAAVTATLFATLGVAPQLGATFNPDGKGDPRSVVLSHRLWQRRFGAAGDVVGRSVSLNGTPHAIVGVMPPGFAWPESAELWVPLVVEASMGRGYHLLQVVGRLRSGATADEARAELATIAAASAAAYPEFNKDWGVEVSSLLESTVGATSRPLLILTGAAACVLLIACANVAGLLTSRALTRRQEVSVRSALGASRTRIIRQLLTESLVLSIAGGAAGLALAAWAMPWLLSLTTLPRAAGVAIDTPVLAVTVLVSVATGLLFGLAPAVTASRSELPHTMTVRGSAATGWMRPALLVIQVAAALVLLAGAGLMLRSFHKLQQVDTGISVDRILTARFFLPRASYPVERCVALYRQMIDRVSALPGVETAAAASVFPYSGASANVVFTIPGRPPAAPGDVMTANFSATTPGYFRAMGIPIVAGRGFEPADRAGAPFVAVVNRAMAARYFPGGNPIGQTVRILGPTPRTIVGVIPDLRQRALNTPAEPEIHVPHEQFPTGGMFLVVRAQSDRPEQLAASVRAAVRSLDRDLPIAAMRTGEALIGETLSSRRLSMVLLSIFAILALVLSVIGVYGVLSFTVSQRAREIGIRMALGAAAADVLGLMLWKGLWPVAAGLALGLGAALATTRVLTKMLFEVRPTDPLVLLGVVGLLLSAAFVAVLVPALRASRVDPLIAVRSE